jgi:hypothetical protein
MISLHFEFDDIGNANHCLEEILAIESFRTIPTFSIVPHEFRDSHNSWLSSSAVRDFIQLQIVMALSNKRMCRFLDGLPWYFRTK